MKLPYSLDSLALKTMASGHLCLNLTEQIGWAEFPAFADKFIDSIGGTITHRSDGSDLRLWEICLDEHVLRFVFDDYPVMVSLESSDDKGDATLERLHRELASMNNK